MSFCKMIAKYTPPIWNGQGKRKESCLKAKSLLEKKIATSSIVSDKVQCKKSSNGKFTKSLIDTEKHRFACLGFLCGKVFVGWANALAHMADCEIGRLIRKRRMDKSHKLASKIDLQMQRPSKKVKTLTDLIVINQ